MAHNHTIDETVDFCYGLCEGKAPMELEPPIRTRGRASIPLDATAVGQLTQADLALLQEEKGSQSSAIKRISDRHHTLARCLAEGQSEQEAAINSGYVLSRVSVLKADPAFQELLSFYRKDVNRQYLDVHAKLAGVSGDALNEIQERLENEPEKISLGALIDLAKMGADRTGFGPQSSSTQLNINVDMATRLEAARKRVEARRLIDG